jgi:hypothetical protein
MRLNFKIPRLRKQAAKRQSLHCYYCNCVMTSRCPQLSCTAEHLIPRSNKGKDTKSNIVAACKFCNSMRHRQYPALTPSDYAQIVRKFVELKKWHEHHPAWPSLA